jgi:hypothetical protein
MHHELIHDALQEEEARAMVIEVDPEQSREEEEYYAWTSKKTTGMGTMMKTKKKNWEGRHHP